MIETAEKKERFILAAASDEDREDVERSLDELSDLLDTDGGEEAGRILQLRERWDKRTYLGKGKIEELAELVKETKADGVICDDEISPSQMRNISNALSAVNPDIKVLDRTLLILDIFALHATSREGKLQVLMAQLRDRKTRLSGEGVNLSRLGGGIGTRGPGESKLESDRRVLTDRIAAIRRELDEVAKSRGIQREKRQESPVPVAAIVGYTNAGKSTLLNALTGADVLAQNKLFATLDATTRSCELEDGTSVLLTDTVGFISKLPHQLVESFKSTLEEAKYADFLIHVVDASSETAEQQIDIVYKTLDELGAGDKPVITVLNKQDAIPEEEVEARIIKDLKADKTVKVSMKTGYGKEALLAAISEVVKNLRKTVELVISYADAGKLNLVHKYGTVLKEEYAEDGIHVEAVLSNDIAGKLMK
ncbi:MAG TPA: GTPase HflX [Lachnospiraceae bacterium]|nr:GTPase HflX [Lachnospiraceae bacterium]